CIHIGRIAFGDFGQYFLRRRIHSLKRLARFGGNPGAIDKTLGMPNLGHASLFGDGSHGIDLRFLGGEVGELHCIAVKSIASSCVTTLSARRSPYSGFVMMSI